MSAATPVGISPEDIRTVAKTAGYEERRESVSATLFFKEKHPAAGVPACLINVFYTTRSIMTYLSHPGSAGTNELWRSNAYDTLEELMDLFRNPRMHTGKGYRNAQKAVRGCVACGMMKTREEFSRNQWIKGPDANRCTECLVTAANDTKGPWDNSNATTTESLISGMEQLNLQNNNNNNDSLFPTLTEQVLQTHDKKVNNKLKDKGGDKNNMTRRQFNCPECPKHGRGPFIFFKKVPSFKPICKCPQCKKVTRGNCKRLYPVPKQAEKGYGLFRCTKCSDKWGSSRAVANLGQECFSCAKKGESVFVTPFRLERHKKKKGGGRGMRRVPREPIGEDEADEREYGDADRRRNEFGGDQGGGGDGGEAYSFEPREQVFDADSLSGEGRGDRPVVGADSLIPSGYQHKCSGCASGACKSRKVPFSEMHDTSDGNTVSTRSSVVTDSSIDKTDFFDRDEEFSGFEDTTNSGLDSDDDWVKA